MVGSDSEREFCRGNGATVHMTDEALEALAQRRGSSKWTRLLGILFVMLSTAVGVLYFLFVKSVEWHLDYDRIVCVLHLTTDSSLMTYGQPSGLALSVKKSWIYYSVAALIGLTLCYVIRRRTNSSRLSAEIGAVAAQSSQPWRWPRLQISLRNLLLLVLVFGILLPAGYYHIRNAQQQHLLFSTQRVSVGNCTAYEEQFIRRQLRPLSLWEAIWHRQGRQLGRVHELTLIRPRSGAQNYQVLDIEIPDNFQEPKYLCVRVAMGAGVSGGSLDLFAGDTTVSGTPQEQNEIRIKSRLATLYDVSPEVSAALIFAVKPGEKYKLGATGNWGGKVGDQNTALISMRLHDF